MLRDRKGKSGESRVKIFEEIVGDLQDNPVLLSGMFATLNIDI